MFQKDAYVSVDFITREITIIRRDESIAGDLIPGMDIRQLSFSESDALQDELASYIQAVRTRHNPVVSRRTLAISACSHMTGAPAA